jgi:transposase
VNTWTEEDLEKAIRVFGEEPHARRIAKGIVEARKAARIIGTLDLVSIIKERFGVDYGPTGVSAVLHRLGFSRQKARPHHPKKDEAAQPAFKGGSAIA